jgi:hypothetical protein
MFDDVTMPGSEKERKPFPHYYGDLVRIFLVVIGLTMLGSMLVDMELLGLNLIFGTFSVLLLTLVAGLMSPINKKTMLAALVGLGLLFLF